MVVLPMLTILSITSTEVVPLIFGEKWARSGEVASILTLMALFALLVNFDRAVYFAVGRPGVELTLVLFIVASHLAVVAIFAPMGLTVLAVALLARSALTWPVRVLALRRVAGMTWSAYSGVALALFGSASTGVLLLTLRSYVFKDGNVADLAFTVTIGLAAYASLMSLVSREFRALVVRALGATRRASSGVTK
jgi:O-antigen/teichoic acid export membrane protein